MSRKSRRLPKSIPLVLNAGLNEVTISLAQPKEDAGSDDSPRQYVWFDSARFGELPLDELGTICKVIYACCEIVIAHVWPQNMTGDFLPIVWLMHSQTSGVRGSPAATS